MGMELKQGAGNAGTFDAAFVDDKSGNNSLHMQANSRVLTTLIGVLSQTSPGVLIGTGGDTSMTLPPGAVPVDISIFGQKNAGTTSGSIVLGIDTTSNYFLASYNVANAPTGLGQQSPSTVANMFLALAGLPAGFSHQVTGSYSETATSGSGGPWFVMIDYYKPSPA